MKIIKYLLFLILILIIAGSIYVATKDGDYKVGTSRVINAPSSLLFNEINDLSNWSSWEGWASLEEIHIETTEDPTGPGAELRWQSDAIRDGAITTTSAIPHTQIEQDLLMETSVGKAQAQILWELEPVAGGTKVSWILSGSQDFKEKLAFSIQERDLVDIFLPIFEANLVDLEKNVIRKMEEYSIHVDGVTQHGGGYYMYTATAAKLEEVNARARTMIEQVRAFMENNNISISGKPMIIYNQRDEQNRTSIFSAGVPTPSQVVTPMGSDYLNGYLEPQRVLKTTLKGNRKNTPEAWEAARRYIEQQDLRVDPQGQPFEIYLTNPTEVENPADWITEIYIPVETKE